jgi:hypothetical protein
MPLATLHLVSSRIFERFHRMLPNDYFRTARRGSNGPSSCCVSTEGMPKTVIKKVTKLTNSAKL